MPATLTDTQRAFAQHIAEVLSAIPAAQPKDPEPKPAAAPADDLTVQLGNLLKDRRPGDTFVLDDKGHIQPVVEVGNLLGVIERPLNSVKLPGDIPVGSIAVGAGVGIISSEVINGLWSRTDPAAKNTNLMVKVGAVVALGMFGNKLMSKQATVAAASIVGAQVIADVLPLDTLVAKIVSLIRGTGTPTANRMANRVAAGQGPLHRSPSMDSLSVLGGVGG